MYKWSLLLLASLAVFHPIASFTERSLVDGRQQCCDPELRPLHRDTRLALYGTYRFNKLISGEHRLNDQRNIPEIRRYEVRSVKSAFSRESESPRFRRVVTDRGARFSRLDRRADDRIDRQERLSRRISQDRLSRVSISNERDYRDGQIRTSRDDTATVANERRSRKFIEGRRDQRLLTRPTDNIREKRATRLERNIQQRTRNDVVQANIRNRRVSREVDYIDLRSLVAHTESRRQNVRDNNKEYRSLKRRVRDVSYSRLPLARSRTASVNRQINNDEREIRNVNLNRRVTRELFNEERKVRQIPASLRVTDSPRVSRVLHIRDQTREDLRQERRSANPEWRVARTDERQVRMGTRTESGVRSEERQTKRIREEAQRSSVEANRRNFRSTYRSLTRGNDIERRLAARSLDRRTNRVVRNNIRRVRDTRDEREIRDAEHQDRRTLNKQTMEIRRTISMNTRLHEIRGVDKIIARRDSRTSRPSDVRMMNMVEQMARVMENGRRFTSTRMEVQSKSRNNEQERHAVIRTDRRMERSRREAREEMSLARQARSTENMRSERRDTRFDSRADARNQRSLERVQRTPREVRVVRSNSRNDEQERYAEIRRYMERSLREAREEMPVARQARSVENVRFERRDTRFSSGADTRNQRNLDRAEERTRPEARERMFLARHARSAKKLRSDRLDTRFDTRADTRSQRSSERLEERSRRDARERISLARRARSVENIRSDLRDTRFDSNADTRSESSDRVEERSRREARERMSLARPARSVENVRSERRDARFDSRADTRSQRSSERVDEMSRREARERMSLARPARSVENVRSERRDARFDSRVDTRSQRSSKRVDEMSRREARERMSLARSARSVENVRSERRDARFDARADTRSKSSDRVEERSRREARERMSSARPARSVEKVRSERRDARFDSRDDTRSQRSSERVDEMSRREARERMSLTRQTRSVENVGSERRDARFDSRADTRSKSSDRVEERSRREARERMSSARPARSVENVRSERRDARFDSRADTRSQRSSERVDEMSRREARERMSLTRQTRSVENVGSERRDARFDSKADTRSQRSSERVDEMSAIVVRESRKLERDVSRPRDAKINDERIQAVKESRNREIRYLRPSETRSRFFLEEAARYRHNFVSKEVEQTSHVLNWQYLFYTLQGIYLCGVIMKLVNENPDKQKIRSLWGMTTKAIKVD